MKVLIDDAISIFTFDVDKETNILDLKKLIEDKQFIPNSMISLSYNSRELNDNELVHIVCDDGDLIDFKLNLYGGMRRKWRKKRMRRMKRLRRKMRARAK
jgi:hypothetical protein